MLHTLYNKRSAGGINESPYHNSGGPKGEGPEGPEPPFRPDTCLRLKFLHQQDHISLFNWLIFFHERGPRNYTCNCD